MKRVRKTLAIMYRADAEDRRKVEALAEQEGCTLSEVLRYLVDREYGQRCKPAHESATA